MHTVCIFSTQRPSATGHLALLQGNALRSWCALNCPIVLMGAECSTSYVNPVPSTLQVLEPIGRNDKGVPYIGAMFHAVQKAVRADLYCYVNADVIFDSSFLQIASMPNPGGLFIAAGCRWDVPVNRDIPTAEFANAGKFRGDMQQYSAKHGKRHSPDGIDYFVFPSGMTWPTIPDIVIGHPAWDNWMLWDVRNRGGRLIDLTPVVDIYHQDHPCVYQGDLTVKNRAIVGRHLRTMRDATHVFSGGQLRRK